MAPEGLYLRLWLGPKQLHDKGIPAAQHWIRLLTLGQIDVVVQGQFCAQSGQIFEFGAKNLISN